VYAATTHRDIKATESDSYVELEVDARLCVSG